MSVRAPGTTSSPALLFDKEPGAEVASVDIGLDFNSHQSSSTEKRVPKVGPGVSSPVLKEHVDELMLIDYE